MTTNDSFVNAQLPRTARYNPDWIRANVGGGANSLWLTEWLSSAMELQPAMRILDLGCGLATSSIFLNHEFGVEVWATDLWYDVSQNYQRVRDAGAEDGVFPIHSDARSLPFAPEFFDAIVSIDAYFYFGTDDHYLNYLARFVKPGGQIGIAGAGTMRELEGEVPPQLRSWWTPDCWCLHSAQWWRRHWQRTGIVDIEVADTMTDGWQRWLDWHRTVCPDNEAEIKALEADRGENLGYVRVIARRRTNAKPADPVTSVPSEYSKQPLLRER